MRPACAVAGTVLDEIAAFIRPGVTTRQVDEFAAGRIAAHGAKSAFLGYRKYPCQTCLSVNDEVVHGLATDRELNFGDIVSVDVGDAAERLRGVIHTRIVERDAESIGRALAEITAAPVRTNGPEAVRELSSQRTAQTLCRLYREALDHRERALPAPSLRRQ